MNDLVGLWKNPKYKNIIKLLLWIVFMVFVSCLCIVLNKRQNKNVDIENVMVEIETELDSLNNKKLSVYYKIDDYVVDGTFDNKVFKGSIKYNDGSVYDVKYENDSLVRDNDNGEFVILNVNAKYMDPLYLMELFNENKDIMEKKDNSYYYVIDNVKYYLNINTSGSYSVKMIKDNKESIFEYKVI